MYNHTFVAIVHATVLLHHVRNPAGLCITSISVPLLCSVEALPTWVPL